MKWLGRRGLNIICIIIVAASIGSVAAKKAQASRIDPKYVFEYVNLMIAQIEKTVDKETGKILMRQLTKTVECVLAEGDCADPIFPTGPISSISGTPFPVDGSPFPTPGPSDGSWPFFCQLTARVQDAELDVRGWGIRDNGCGPTGMAMIYCKLSGYDNSTKWNCPVKPADMAKIFMREGGYAGLTIYAGALKAADVHLGLKNTPAGTTNLQTWKNFLDNESIIWAGSRDIPCGIDCNNNPNWRLRHVFVIDAVDIPGQRFRVRNPNDCRRSGDGDEYTSGGQWWNWGAFQIFVAYAMRKS